MKLNTLIFFSLISLSAVASDLKTDSNIHYYSFGACDWWTSVNTNSGSAYGCSMYPQRVNVPDARDVDKALTAAEQRIAALEARVAVLEKKVNGD